VSITLPANYVVGATGDIQTESEVEFLNDLAARGTDRPDLNGEDNFPKSSTRMKSIRYTQFNVHDFGWFADKRWMVLKGEVITPNQKNTVTTWAMFTKSEMKLWMRAPEYLHDAIYQYSLWNGDYPYKQVTAVDGTISAGGGMEYPNITVIGGAGSPRSLEVVIMHEVGHNWFYGILGSNERENAWMDEGLNSFNEERYMADKYPNATMADAIGNQKMGALLGLDDFSQRYLTDISWRFNASRAMDQPLQCHSADFTQLNYGGIVYKKTALLFNYLMAYLGEEKFDRCMHAYFEEWKFRHPQPADLQHSIEKEAGEDLSWFFGELIQTTRKTDFSIQKINRTEDGSFSVRIKNSGETTGPAVVSTVTTDETKAKENALATKATRVLKPGESDQITIPASAQQADLIVIDPAMDIPQINLRNDRMRTTGMLRKMEPLELRVFTGLENGRKTQLFWIPTVAWNEYDKWMPGVTLHNKTVTQKSTEWSFSPMYSFSTDHVNGFANIVHHQGRLSMGVRAQRFSTQNFRSESFDVITGYQMLEPYAEYSFSPAAGTRSDQLRVNLRLSYQVILSKANFESNTESLAGSISQNQEAVRFIANAKYKRGAFDHWTSSVRYFYNTNLIKPESRENFSIGQVFSTELKYRHIYHLKRKKGFSFRGFYGVTFDTGSGLNLFNPAGITGPSDVFLDALYLGRNEFQGDLSRQLVNGMGMLRTALPVYFPEMFAFNAELELPFKVPLTLSANLVADRFENLYDSDQMFGSVVLSVPVIREVFEVHFPLLVSDRIDRIHNVLDYSFMDRVTFTLNISLLSPFKILRNLEF